MKSVLLDEVATFVRGVTFKPEETVFDYTSNAVACFRTKNVQSDLDQRDLIFLPEQCIRREDQFIQPGDMLMSSANSWNLVGKLCWIPPLTYRATAGGFISILRPKNDKIFPRYLYNWVVYPKTQDRLRNCGRQTTNISNLNFRQALNLDLPLPPLEEQKRIADILDKADAIRRKRQEALRLTDEFLRSVFLEIFGDPVTNPKGWPLFPLKSLGRISTGSTPPSSKKDMFGGSIPFITPGDLKGEWVETVRFVTEEGAQEARTIRAGATLVCCIGATIGKMGKSKTHSAFNQQINAVEWNEQVVDNYGLECLKFFKPLIAQKGASTTLPILNKSSFQILEIPLAPIELQERFTRIVKNCEANKAHSQKSLEESQNLFASLQQRAFSEELFQ